MILAHTFITGVDMSECDVCWSKELVPICRHEPFLSQTTDALVKFPNMVCYSSNCFSACLLE